MIWIAYIDISSDKNYLRDKKVFLDHILRNQFKAEFIIWLLSWFNGSYKKCNNNCKINDIVHFLCDPSLLYKNLDISILYIFVNGNVTYLTVFLRLKIVSCNFFCYGSPSPFLHSRKFCLDFIFYLL